MTYLNISKDKKILKSTQSIKNIGLLGPFTMYLIFIFFDFSWMQFILRKLLFFYITFYVMFILKINLSIF